MASRAAHTALDNGEAACYAALEDLFPRITVQLTGQLPLSIVLTAAHTLLHRYEQLVRKAVGQNKHLSQSMALHSLLERSAAVATGDLFGSLFDTATKLADLFQDSSVRSSTVQRALFLLQQAQWDAQRMPGTVREGLVDAIIHTASCQQDPRLVLPWARNELQRAKEQLSIYRSSPAALQKPTNLDYTAAMVLSCLAALGSFSKALLQQLQLQDDMPQEQWQQQEANRLCLQAVGLHLATLAVQLPQPLLTPYTMPSSRHSQLLPASHTTDSSSRLSSILSALASLRLQCVALFEGFVSSSTLLQQTLAAIIGMTVPQATSGLADFVCLGNLSAAAHGRWGRGFHGGVAHVMQQALLDRAAPTPAALAATHSSSGFTEDGCTRALLAGTLALIGDSEQLHIVLWAVSSLRDDPQFWREPSPLSVLQVFFADLFLREQLGLSYSEGAEPALLQTHGAGVQGLLTAQQYALVMQAGERLNQPKPGLDLLLATLQHSELRTLQHKGQPEATLLVSSKLCGSSSSSSGALVQLPGHATPLVLLLDQPGDQVVCCAGLQQDGKPQMQQHSHTGAALMRNRQHAGSSLGCVPVGINAASLLAYTVATKCRAHVLGKLQAAEARLIQLSYLAANTGGALRSLCSAEPRVKGAWTPAPPIPDATLWHHSNSTAPSAYTTAGTGATPQQQPSTHVPHLPSTTAAAAAAGAWNMSPVQPSAGCVDAVAICRRHGGGCWRGMVAGSDEYNECRWDTVRWCRGKIARSVGHTLLRMPAACHMLGQQGVMGQFHQAARHVLVLELSILQYISSETIILQSFCNMLPAGKELFTSVEPHSHLL